VTLQELGPLLKGARSRRVVAGTAGAAVGYESRDDLGAREWRCEEIGFAKLAALFDLLDWTSQSARASPGRLSMTCALSGAREKPPLHVFAGSRLAGSLTHSDRELDTILFNYRQALARRMRSP